MFGRKKTAEPEQGREGRQVARGGAPSPAFSYYTNSRGNEAPSEQREARDQRAAREETGQRREPSRLWTAQAPFWLLLAVFVVCVGKVLYLSDNPKVVVLGTDATSNTYVQPASVYVAAGKQILASSILNHTKLTADVSGVARQLQAKYPELQTVSMDMPLAGSRPVLYLEVAQPSVVVQAASGNYALNSDGLVLAKLRSIPAHVPLVADQTGNKPVVGKQFLPGSTVAYIQSVNYQFDMAKLDINTCVLPADAPYEMDVRLSGQQYQIRMNLQADARLQSGAAIATLRQLGSSTPGEYLDVRTPERVYYR